MILGLCFSKDRAMQLDATLHSLKLHCRDAHRLNTTVLHAASTDTQARHYRQLAQEYPAVRFVQETDFRRDVISLVAPSEFLLFMVDDNIFVKDFDLEDAISQLKAIPQALAFSFRLGRNTVYCYPLAKYQKLPKFDEVSNGVLGFDWTKSERDFGYPYDVSSTIYRTGDIVLVLEGIPFSNPNTLEGALDGTKRHTNSRNLLLCFERSVTFCNPINKVQSVLPNNRSGKRKRYTPSRLAEMFEGGYRINVEAYANFVPTSCHQEVGLKFECSGRDSSEERSALVRWLARILPGKSSW